MEKIVETGINIATVNLDGTECKVTFESDYPYFYVTNLGSSDVYASFESGSAADADGVYTIPAGSTRPLMVGLSAAKLIKSADTLYITGSGKVQIEGSMVQISGFKDGQKGGEPSGCIFSTDEQVVGTWIDGRTIYKKTIILDAPRQSTTGKTVVYHNHNISDIDLIWFGGESFWSANNAQHTMSLTFGLGDDLNTNYTYFFSCAIDSTKITIQFGSSYSNVAVYATVMYIKNN